MRSSTVARERARPLLGTIVRIRIPGSAAADATIDAAFAEIAMIHRLMSFQEPGSDLGRIGRAMAGEHIPVDGRTVHCIDAALRWAQASGGGFDPVAIVSPDADWRDVVIEGNGVRIRRALRLDLSGIAKGHAVDRACDVLAAHGIETAVVEAGGDLRVIGPVEEEVALRPAVSAPPALVMLADGALASSDPALARAQTRHVMHRDGRTRSASADRFVAVAAPRCTDADALAKVVLALGDAATPLLERAAATAYCFDGTDWTVAGAQT